jgi:hypothetical protein
LEAIYLVSNGEEKSRITMLKQKIQTAKNFLESLFQIKYDSNSLKVQSVLILLGEKLGRIEAISTEVTKFIEDFAKKVDNILLLVKEIGQQYHIGIEKF